ncbi:hypothetical protein ACIQ6V_15810 [Streptomyces sp. NPDC096198]|uniref:hypothetical protein n=1 Tax=Streptomyces sp. NPDC096198 TaxID=3366080 RepID=UPI0037F84BE8
MALLSRKPRYLQNGLTVPFITTWDAEEMTMPALAVRWGPYGARLAYQDSTPMDWDHHGVLWVRQGLARGKGKALMAQVHAFRQRRAMFDLLCQVCGGCTLEEDFDRQLYVMNSANGQPINERERTTAPPVCTGCAPEAVTSCPRLINRYVAAWVEAARPWGVSGILHDPKTLLPVTEDLVEIPFSDVRSRWIVALRAVYELSGVTAVDLARVKQPA